MKQRTQQSFNGPDGLVPPEEFRDDRTLLQAEQHAAEGRIKGSVQAERYEWLRERYIGLLRRFAKVVRISDGYQHDLLHLNQLLNEAARTDYLTGLANRREVVEKMDVELSRARRHHEDVAVLLLDIDTFKRFNDGYGHQGGDAVLRGVATVLRTSLRLEDLCGRWGGEEFLVCLPNTNREHAAGVAEKLRAGVANLQVEFQGDYLRPTVSIGVAVPAGPSDVPASLDELVQRADKALYAAKNEGRNLVRIAETS